MSDEAPKSSAEWLRETVEAVIPESIRDSQKLKHAFDLVAVADLNSQRQFETRWKERNARASHRQLFGEEVEGMSEKDMIGDDMLVLGNININQPNEQTGKHDMAQKPVPPPAPAAASQPSITKKAAGIGLGTAMALAGGSGLVGAAGTAAYHALTKPDVAIHQEMSDPQLVGDWELLTDE